MIEMKQMIHALRLQEILYLVNVSRAAASSYHVDGSCRLILVPGSEFLDFRFFCSVLPWLSPPASGSCVPRCFPHRVQTYREAGILPLLPAAFLLLSLVRKLGRSPGKPRLSCFPEYGNSA